MTAPAAKYLVGRVTPEDTVAVCTSERHRAAVLLPRERAVAYLDSIQARYPGEIYVLLEIATITTRVGKPYQFELPF